MFKPVVLGMFALMFLLSSDASLATQGTRTAKSADIVTQSSPQANQSPRETSVVLADTEIFLVQTSPVSSLSPENRARFIQQNIQKFADSQSDIKDLKVIRLKEGMGIGNDDVILMVITEADAKESGKTSSDLANEILGNIQISVSSYRTKHNWKIYGLGAAFSILSIVGLWQALFWNNRTYTWLKHKVSQKRGYWKQGIHYKEVELISARRIDGFVLLILKFIRILVILLCWYFFLPLILSFFPETSKLSTKIFEYLIAPFQTIFHTLITYIPNLFYILVIIVIAYYVLKLISSIFGLIEQEELVFEWFYSDWARPTYQIIRFLVIVTALISAYPYIPGSSSNAFQGVGLVLGAIISFASSSAISNIVAGIILTYTRAFKLNDRVKVGETTGDVVEKTLLVTRIMTIKQVIVTIPNSLVMGSQIINYSTSAEDGDGLILHTSVTIGYDVPYKKVQSLLIEAALSTELLQSQPKPFVLQSSLDDFYINYEINAFTKEPHNMATIYSTLHQNILEKFDAAGIEIMSPHYYALRDGNTSTVPSVLNTKGYSAPSFSINQMPKTGE